MPHAKEKGKGGRAPSAKGFRADDTVAVTPTPAAANGTPQTNGRSNGPNGHNGNAAARDA
jgi:hypothetical protein